LLPSPDAGDNSARQLRRAAACLLFLTLLTRLAVAATGAVNGTVVDPASLPAASEASAAAMSASADQTLLLEVQINGHSTGKIGEFTLRHGKLMARPQELRDLGFRLPDSLSQSNNSLIALSELPWLNWSFDEKNQALYVTISDASLLPTVLQANETRDAHRVIESGTGATLNYDIVNTLASGQIGTTGSLDLRAFSHWGVASSGWLAYAGEATNAAGTKTPVRLDSAYTFSDVDTLRRYVLGDFVTGGLAWTRPVHLEGVQIRSDFSMRPDLVTFPLPSVTGSAAVPSTVNVLTDGNLMVSSQVAPGPFEVPQLPVMSGAGTISMTVTNALGQQVTLTQPFYASSALLAPGLQTYAGQAGLVRRNWGSVSNDYGKMAGTAVYRRGLTRKFTVEGSVEGTPGTTMAGAGGVAQIASLGILNFAAAASTGSGQAGAQLSVGAQRIGKRFSVGASATVTEGNYRDVASINGDGAPKKQISAFTSLSSRRFGSVGLAYGESDQNATSNSVQPGFAPVHDSQVVSVNYSLQFRKVSIYASEFKNLSTTGGSNGMQIGLTIPFGRRSSTSVSATSEGSVQFQVQKPASSIGDWGYNAYASAGNSDHDFGQVQYKSPVGLFTAGVDRSAGQTSLRIENQGALSVVDRGLFPSNAITDSFAIVDTGSMPNVRVFQENRDVGSTGTSGRLLVPDMRSFDLNHITIEPTDIPADATIINASREIRPQDRSGVIVSFPIKISHGALLQLVDESGVPVPLGSTATLRASGAAVPVGYDGDAYVQDLNSHNEITVDRADGRRCVVAFDYHAVPGDIPTIGPLRCVERKP
jgi:outer membrane usher protein